MRPRSCMSNNGYLGIIQFPHDYVYIVQSELLINAAYSSTIINDEFLTSAVLRSDDRLDIRSEINVARRHE